jgi:uncharacterized membrane protein
LHSAPETDLPATDALSLAAIATPDRYLTIQPAHSKLQIFVLVLAVVFFNAVGNLSLAWGMHHVSESMGLNPLDYLRAMLNPFVIGGVVLLSLWLLTRMALLSWADLSFVLPVTGVGYILAAVFGKLFLAEIVPPSRWLGTVLIVVGTAMVGTTDQQSGVPRK